MLGPQSCALSGCARPRPWSLHGISMALGGRAVPRGPVHDVVSLEKCWGLGFPTHKDRVVFATGMLVMKVSLLSIADLLCSGKWLRPHFACHHPRRHCFCMRHLAHLSP